MQTKKMSLANIQGKLSRSEMKNIMAGSDYGGGYCGSVGSAQNCPPHTTAEKCDSQGRAYCKDGNGNCYFMGVATCSF
jgi:hypothetical protein